MHLYTVIFAWSPVFLVAFWSLPLSRQILVLLAVQPIQMLIAWGAAVVVAKWLRCDRGQTGVLILIAALSNQGFTLGAYLCYAVLDPAQQAMSYAIAYVAAMQVFMVVIFYPVARHYGHVPADGTGPSVGRLIAASFIDIRSTPLYAAPVGLLLNVSGVALPAWIGQYHIMEIMFFIGAIGSYAGIGLRLRLGDSRTHLKLHIAAAVIRFVAVPAAILGVIGLLHLSPWAMAPLPRSVLIIECLTPAAIASVIVPNLFGLDARLASVLWLWNTITFSVICLPIILLVF
jgi:predicted permease